MGFFVLNFNFFLSLKVCSLNSLCWRGIHPFLWHGLVNCRGSDGKRGFEASPCAQACICAYTNGLTDQALLSELLMNFLSTRIMKVLTLEITGRKGR